MRIITFWKLLLILVLTYTPALSFDEADLKKFLAVPICEGCDLSGADLIGAYLPYANLEGADLSGAKLGDADLEEANLSGANLRKVKVPGANFSGADLSTAIWGYTADLSTAISINTDNFYGAILCKTLTPWGEDNSGC